MADSDDIRENPESDDLGANDPGFLGSEGPFPSEGGVDARNMEEREVQIHGVYENPDQSTAPSNPFLLIRDNHSRCVLIWIGRYEAVAIQMAMEKASVDRPLTHDLLKNVIERLGCKVERIVIDDLWQETFYAKIWMTQPDGTQVSVDARPSDAVALAIKVHCPIYMTEAVLEEAGRPMEEYELGEGG